MTFAISGLMLYTMWVILVLLGLDLIADVYRGLKGQSFSLPHLANYLNGILYHVFPLFIVANIIPLDPTGWLVLIAYYVGAIGVIAKYLINIYSKL